MTKLRFDGRAFVPDSPISVPVGHVIDVELPPPPTEQFRRLAVNWTNAVGHQSSSSVRYGHPAYQAIIALGWPAVPLLLRELETSPKHWFAALSAITGINPVAPDDRGHVDKMSDAWIRWGRAGFVSEAVNTMPITNA